MTTSASAMNLADFLARSTARPFRYGAHDCCLWLADWLVALGRPDPAADLRGRYRTELGCARILKREGGVLAVVGACAAHAGLQATQTAIAGDVGVVPVLTAKGEALSGAICTGRRWATLGRHGLLVAEVAPIAAWRV